MIGQVRDTRLPNRVGNAHHPVNQELIPISERQCTNREKMIKSRNGAEARAESMTEAWRGKPALEDTGSSGKYFGEKHGESLSGEQGIAVGLDTESIEARFM